MDFLYWLYLTPGGLTVFATFLAITAALVFADGRRETSPVDRPTTFDHELALLRRELRVIRDPRNN